MHIPNPPPTSLGTRNRPTLKRRTIPRHSRKIAIVQPIQNLILLLQPCKFHISVAMRAQRRAFPPTRRKLRIPRREPRADQQDVAYPDIPTLSLRPDVEALRGGAEG